MEKIKSGNPAPAGNMDKADFLAFVEELQMIREKFNNATYFSTLPIEHSYANFNEGMDTAVEAVMQVYSEIVLTEVQNQN